VWGTQTSQRAPLENEGLDSRLYIILDDRAHTTMPGRYKEGTTARSAQAIS